MLWICVNFCSFIWFFSTWNIYKDIVIVNKSYDIKWNYYVNLDFSSLSPLFHRMLCSDLYSMFCLQFWIQMKVYNTTLKKSVPMTFVVLKFLCFMFSSCNFLGIFICKYVQNYEREIIYIILCSNIHSFFYFMHICIYFPMIYHLASTQGTLLFPTCPPASLIAHNWSYPPLVSVAALFTSFLPFRNYQ